MLLALVCAAALVPFFVTLNDYIPILEKELSARVGEPVSIDNLQAALLPVPHARVEGISIGTAEDVQVGKVTLKPDLWSLLRSQKVIRSVELEDVTLTQKSLGALAALSQGDRGAGSVRVGNVRLSNAVVKLERSKFGPFDVHVRVSGAGEQGLVTLKTRDNALEAKAIPDGEQYRIEISARKWTPPMGPAFVFDQLEVKGVVRAEDADLPAITAKLYGGTATGAVKLEWDKGIAIKGNLDLQAIEVTQPVAILSPNTRVSGRLDAKPAFSAHAASAEQLDDALKLESPFTVRDGVLHGFDIAAAAASLGKHTRGGETRFDRLSGKLAVERRSYRFTDLNIASGALAARGNVAISPSKALSGQLSANATTLGKSVSIPLAVSGTLDSPMLLPNAAAIAGAVAGTAVLPGIGTAAGAKVGEVVNGLFGKKQ
ncbi:MAG TPA: hypothetical protein VHP37_07335 [Burkholderiales bacterium]|nr:hypothetical protein [Burkholderiales bacterium]